jgi:putative methyltransferase (TIGR04325 family)
MSRVRDGECAYERDGVVFEEVQLSFPVLAGLLRASAADAGRLAVIDFGGALGSSYYQCRKFLSLLPDLAWAVVEQENFVRCGREEFAYDAIERALGGAYRTVARFDCVWDGSHTEYSGGLAFESKGMILERVA